jgi:putative oxidoreductase
MLSVIRNRDFGLLLVRLAIGIPMLFYGISKVVYGVEPILEMVENHNLPGFFTYGVYVGEVLAPLMLVVGFYVRAAALLFSINGLCALLIGQSSAVFKLNDYGGWAIEVLFMYIVVGLSLCFTGGGSYALQRSEI